MPISSLKSSTPSEEVRLVGGLSNYQGTPWSVRINNQLGGFAIDKTTLLVSYPLDVVVLGHTPLVGLVPPRNTYDSLLEAIKSDKCRQPQRLSPEEQLKLFIQQNLKPYALVHYVPVPRSLDAVSPDLKACWPKYVVTASYVRSFGLTQNQTGFYGPMGLVQKLETSGISFLDGIVTVGGEEHSSTDRRYFINDFSFRILDKDDPDMGLLKKCRKFVEGYIKENPGATELPGIPDNWVIPVSISDILQRTDGFLAAAARIVEMQARVFDPIDYNVLAPKIMSITESLLSDDLLLTPGEDIPTVDVDAIEPV